jgi:hypothetical protein
MTPNLDHPGGQGHCRCCRCRVMRSKSARIEQVASEMRERHQRVIRIRQTVLARRGNGPHYPKQDVR